MAPTGRARRRVDGLAELRWDEARQAVEFRRRRGGCGLCWRARFIAVETVFAVGAVGVPDRIAVRARLEHERLWCAAFAGGNFVEPAAGCDGLVFVEDSFAVPVGGVVVAMLDEQPVVVTLFLAALHADERP